MKPQDVPHLVGVESLSIGYVNTHEIVPRALIRSFFNILLIDGSPYNGLFGLALFVFSSRCLLVFFTC